MDELEIKALKDLINNVARMRKAQKGYFGTKPDTEENKATKQSFLIESKELERKVDAEIESLRLKKA